LLTLLGLVVFLRKLPVIPYLPSRSKVSRLLLMFIAFLIAVRSSVFISSSSSINCILASTSAIYIFSCLIFSSFALFSSRLAVSLSVLRSFSSDYFSILPCYRATLFSCFSYFSSFSLLISDNFSVTWFCSSRYSCFLVYHSYICVSIPPSWSSRFWIFCTIS
jgi:hypothetical protein